MLGQRTGVYLIANPTAGQGRAKRIAVAAYEEFSCRGYPAELQFTAQLGHGIDIAHRAYQDGYRLVVAVGGDGTIAEVANGIAGTGTIMGVIPGGTANDFVKETGLPLNLRSAVDVIIRGKTRRIDLGKTDTGRYFLNVAGIGFDAAVIENLDLRLKYWLKDTAYVVAAIKTLMFYKPPLLKIKADGNQYEGSFAVIGNTRYYGGIFKVTPKAATDDGYLDLCIFSKTQKASLYKYLAGAIGQFHLRFRDVSYLQVKKIEVKSAETIPVQADGDIIGVTPIEFEVAPGVLEVIVP
ncbi:MAG: diacylglycerol kinase family lipid kinase [Firmicutes bacterium]|nr:diacylglycerol kinase family lipid kinase [Bacillota bacterium]